MVRRTGRNESTVGVRILIVQKSQTRYQNFFVSEVRRVVQNSSGQGTRRTLLPGFPLPPILQFSVHGRVILVPRPFWCSRNPRISLSSVLIGAKTRCNSKAILKLIYPSPGMIATIYPAKMRRCHTVRLFGSE